MEVKDLSILIPARNENFLAKTIDDILKHIEADTEVIALLDGEWADPVIPQHDRVNIIYVPESVGQRAGTNLAARIAKGKYLMKVDAHCCFDQGFDRKMVEFFAEHGDNMTAVPVMRNLHVFDWKCYECGWTKYQGPTPEKKNGQRVCPQCGKAGKVRRKMRWIGKHNPQSYSYCFDSEPHFQYFEDWKHRYVDGKKNKDIAKEQGWNETMSLQGSCFMTTKENYWKWDLGGESFGSWGNQGLQVACDTWLSGARVLVNHNTWYAHLFRTQGGDFGFPYHIGGREVQKTKTKVWEDIKGMKRPSQTKPVSWLVEKFWPVPGWTEENLEELKKAESSLKSRA